MFSQAARTSRGVWWAAIARQSGLTDCIAPIYTLRSSYQFSTSPQSPLVAKWIEDVSANRERHQVDYLTMIDPISLKKLAATIDPEFDGYPSPWMLNGVRGVHPAAHWMIDTNIVATKDLAEDGFLSDFQPPAPYTTRMWGGGEIVYHVRSPKAMEEVRVVSRHGKPPVFKQGKSGGMVIVTRENNYYGDASLDQPLVTDSTFFIYRNPSDIVVDKEGGKTGLYTPSGEPDWMRPVDWLSKHTLFRYSAVTFNTHSIHYCDESAKKDGHRGVLVHGPLTATLMLDLLGQVSEELVGHESAPSVGRHLALLMLDRYSTSSTAADFFSNLSSIPESQRLEAFAKFSMEEGAKALNDPSFHAMYHSTPFHTRAQQLTKLTYRAHQPLLVNTNVCVCARKKDRNSAKITSYREKPEEIELWVEGLDSEGKRNGVVYMSGVGIFDAPQFTYNPIEMMTSGRSEDVKMKDKDGKVMKVVDDAMVEEYIRWSKENQGDTQVNQTSDLLKQLKEHGLIGEADMGNEGVPVKKIMERMKQEMEGKRKDHRQVFEKVVQEAKERDMDVEYQENTYEDEVRKMTLGTLGQSHATPENIEKFKEFVEAKKAGKLLEMVLQTEREKMSESGHHDHLADVMRASAIDTLQSANNSSGIPSNGSIHEPKMSMPDFDKYATAHEQGNAPHVASRPTSSDKASSQEGEKTPSVADLTKIIEEVPEGVDPEKHAEFKRVFGAFSKSMENVDFHRAAEKMKERVEAARLHALQQDTNNPSNNGNKGQ